MHEPGNPFTVEETREVLTLRLSDFVADDGDPEDFIEESEASIRVLTNVANDLNELFRYTTEDGNEIVFAMYGRPGHLALKWLVDESFLPGRTF